MSSVHVKDDQWIVIPKWADFQHYTERSPIWIKNYTRLLHDINYMQLSAAQRGILHGLWLLAASTGEAVTSTTAKRFLSLSQSDAKHWRTTLQRLNHAGFIHLLDSKPLANRYQRASTIEEKEKKKLLRDPGKLKCRYGCTLEFASETKRDEHERYLHAAWGDTPLEEDT